LFYLTQQWLKAILPIENVLLKSGKCGNAATHLATTLYHKLRHKQNAEAACARFENVTRIYNLSWPPLIPLIPWTGQGHTLARHSLHGCHPWRHTRHWCACQVG